MAELAGLDTTMIGAMEPCDYTDLGIRKVVKVLNLPGYQFSFTSMFMPALNDWVAWQQEAGQEAKGSKSQTLLR